MSRALPGGPPSILETPNTLPDRLRRDAGPHVLRTDDVLLCLAHLRLRLPGCDPDAPSALQTDSYRPTRTATSAVPARLHLVPGVPVRKNGPPEALAVRVNVPVAPAGGHSTGPPSGSLRRGPRYTSPSESHAQRLRCARAKNIRHPPGPCRHEQRNELLEVVP